MGRRPAGRLLGLLGLAALLAVLGLVTLADAGTGSRTRGFGHSAQGRRLEVRRTGPRHAATHVLVVGEIHGNERAGEPIVSRLRRVGAPRRVEIWTVLEMNPDGAEHDARQNARGVDLNRNFPRGWRAQGSPWDTYYSGPSPASEPETRAAMRLVKRVRPDVTIWYHQAEDLVDASRGAKRRLVRRYAHVARMRVKRLPPLPGTATRWENRKWPRDNAFVVELPGGSLPASAVHRHARAVRAVARLARG